MYDFSKVAELAKKAIGQSTDNGEVSYKYPLVYPGVGKIKFRMLYNPKSGLIIRGYSRHKIDGKAVPCLRTYGEECPICKALEEVENYTGKKPQGSKAFRAVFMAQYVWSDYKIGTEDHPINVGDTIVVMVPWSVYKEVNAMIDEISRDPEALTTMFSAPSIQTTFEITRDQDNKYSFRASFPNTAFKSANTQEEFEAYLEDLEDLNEQCQSAVLKDEDVQLVNATADTILQQIRPSSIAQSNDNPKSVGELESPKAEPSAVITPPTMLQPQFSSPSTTVNDDLPPCFGKYRKYNDPTHPEYNESSQETQIYKGMCKYCPNKSKCEVM